MTTVTQKSRASTMHRVVLAAAIVWSLLLIAAAVVAPMYRGTTTRTGADGTTVSVDWSPTLVAENGGWAVVVMSVPLVVSLLVVLALVRLPPVAATVVGWLLVTLLLVFAAVALFSVGLYMLPVAVLLALTMATARTSPR